MERITYQDMPAGMFDMLMNAEKFIANSSLDHRLMGLMKLRASQMNGCAYCVDMHYKELVHLGESDLRLSSLCVWEETPYFSEKERAALFFTETGTQINHKPFPDTIFDMVDTFFTKKEIAFLSLVVTQINTWNRLMKIFRTPPGEYQVKQ